MKSPSCGCFGRFSPNPWYAFGIDCAALVALLSCKPVSVGTTLAGVQNTTFPLIPVSWVAFGLLCGWLLTIVGSPHFAFFHDINARLTGRVLKPEPESLFLGKGDAQEVREVSLKMTNGGDHTTTIVGNNSSCSCVATADLPLTIRPGESRAARVRVRFGGLKGPFAHEVIFLTDSPSQPTVRAWVWGETVP